MISSGSFASYKHFVVDVCYPYSEFGCLSPLLAPCVVLLCLLRLGMLSISCDCADHSQASINSVVVTMLPCLRGLFIVALVADNSAVILNKL